MFIAMKKCALFSALCLFSTLSSAEGEDENKSQPLRVVTHSSTGWASSAYQGFAPELHYLLTRHLPKEVSFEVLPIRRAILTFGNGESDCYMGGPGFQGLTGDRPVLRSEPITMDQAFVFSRKGEPTVSEFTELYEKSMAVQRGFELMLQERHRIQINIDLPADAQSGFKMLRSGRVDYLLAFTDALTIEMKEQLSFDENLVVHSNFGYVHCYETSETKVYIDHINTLLSSVDKHRYLNDVYQIYGRTVPEF